MAKDAILKHHIFADIMTAMPLTIKDGDHKAGSADAVVFACLPSSDNTSILSSMGWWLKPYPLSSRGRLRLVS